MRTGTRLTIQDYLRNIGLQRPTSLARSARNPGGKETGGAFSQVLTERQSRHESGPRGLTIQDYLAKPVAIPNVRPQHLPVLKPGPTAPAADVQVHHAQGHSANSADSLDPSLSRVRTDPKNTPIPVKDQIETSIGRAASRYDLPKTLIRAVVRAESGYQVSAVSPAGAQGLMQLMPGTAKELGVTDPFDIDQNIDGGSKYLRAMLDRFNGDVKVALSAYNAGPGTVARYDGHVPYAETRNYVSRVMKFAGLPSGPIKS